MVLLRLVCVLFSTEFHLLWSKKNGKAVGKFQISLVAIQEAVGAKATDSKPGASPATSASIQSLLNFALTPPFPVHNMHAALEADDNDSDTDDEQHELDKLCETDDCKDAVSAMRELTAKVETLTQKKRQRRRQNKNKKNVIQHEKTSQCAHVQGG